MKRLIQWSLPAFSNFLQRDLFITHPCRDFRLENITYALPYKTSHFEPPCDSFFISQNDQFEIIGVFDGVGGWDLQGVDSGYFTHKFARLCEGMVENDECGTTPKYLLQSAFEEALLDSSVPEGSATCLINYFDKSSAELHSTVLGDTSIFVCRPGGDENMDYYSLYKQRDLQHDFNVPYHLAKGMLFGKGTDYPYQALDKTLQLFTGDVIIAASDGLFDNMYLEQMIELLNCSEMDSLEDFIERMVHLAHGQSLDLAFESPFSERMSIQKMHPYTGGKPDDITVVVSRVCE